MKRHNGQQLVSDLIDIKVKMLSGVRAGPRLAARSLSSSQARGSSMETLNSLMA